MGLSAAVAFIRCYQRTAGPRHRGRGTVDVTSSAMAATNTRTTWADAPSVFTSLASSRAIRASLSTTSLQAQGKGHPLKAMRGAAEQPVHDLPHPRLVTRADPVFATGVDEV
jgi:alpha-ketoglutarate-dependent taurine dioxygenase